MLEYDGYMIQKITPNGATTYEYGIANGNIPLP
jgi:hypothetical protein